MKQLILGFVLITYIFVCVKATNDQSTDEPLFLTSLIESGQIDEAKDRAAVKHPQLKDTQSYAGYLTINKLYNSNTFFWFFPSQNNPSNDPLLVWMNGGPGSTSLVGLFAENGPFIITENGTVEMRKYSWHINHNIIYIDNPVGAGFSFTDDDRGYVRTQDHVGRDVLAALLQFFKLFPEFKKNDFYVTGESYGGKYVPAVSHAIMMYNKNAESKINMKGLAYGNGITDPINQMNRSDFMYDIGLLDLNERNAVAAVEDEVRSLIKQKKYTEALLVFDTLFFHYYTPRPTLFENITGYDYYYNFLQTKMPEEIGRYADWVTKMDVRRALHVGNSVFNKSSQVVKEYLKGDLIQSIAHYVAELVEDYKVLIFSGQLDICVPSVTTENYLEHLNWSGASEYKTASKKQWRVQDEIAGYSKTAKNLNLVLVRNAGHFVPTDQPMWAWDMITRFTRDLEF